MTTKNSGAGPFRAVPTRRAVEGLAASPPEVRKQSVTFFVCLGRFVVP